MKMRRTTTRTLLTPTMRWRTRALCQSLSSSFDMYAPCCRWRQLCSDTNSWHIQGPSMRSRTFRRPYLVRVWYTKAVGHWIAGRLMQASESRRGSWMKCGETKHLLCTQIAWYLAVWTSLTSIASANTENEYEHEWHEILLCCSDLCPYPFLTRPALWSITRTTEHWVIEGARSSLPRWFDRECFVSSGLVWTQRLNERYRLLDLTHMVLWLWVRGLYGLRFH